MKINFKVPIGSNNKWILVLAGMILMIFVLEIGLQIKQKIALNKYKGQTETPKQQQILAETAKIPFEYQPYVIWRAKPNTKSDYFGINSLGFRDKEFTKEKENGRYRIAILGGSAAWGYGSSSNDKTIDSLLEEKLKEANFNNKNVEVLNFAEIGYNSSQETALWNEMMGYKPDLVIQFTGYNDIYGGFLGLKAGWNYPFIKESLISKNNWGIIGSLLKEEFEKNIGKSALYRSINFRTKKPEEIRTKYTDIKSISDIFIRNIFIEQQIGKGAEIAVITIIQPSLFTEKRELTEAEKTILKEYEKNFPGAVEYFKNGYREIIENLTKNQINFIDGTVFFEKEKETVYFDTVHSLDNGNQIIAEQIAKLVISQKNF